eukprot:Em0012g571a
MSCDIPGYLCTPGFSYPDPDSRSCGWITSCNPSAAAGIRVWWECEPELRPFIQERQSLPVQMADSKELCDAKKERDVAIAKRDAWKKELEEGSSLKCKQVAQANEKLTQCQQQLELERKGVKYLAIQTETMKKGCKQAGSDLLRVMNEVETKSQVDIAELTKKVQSLEQEIQQWKYKYESMVAENETKSAPARMRLKDLEDQMESMEQMSSERHSDLISKISELEITVKELEAKIMKHSEKSK